MTVTMTDVARRSGVSVGTVSNVLHGTAPVSDATRTRVLAAIEYVKCAAQNAAILIRLAEAARQAPDPAVSAAAEKLLDNSLRLRLQAFQAIPRLYLAILLWRAGLAPHFVADGYDALTRQVVMLGCLQYPTRGMSSAL